MTDNKAFIHATSGSLVTPKGRILWNSLFKPRKGQEGKPGKYEFNLMFPKGSNFEVLKTAALEAGKEKFAKVFKDAAGKWPSSMKNPFKKTADNDKLAEFAEEFPVYIAARSQDAPGVVGPNGKKDGVSPEDVYAGRWARMTCDAFAYDSAGNKGVTFGLKNVQLLDSDDELAIGGGRVSAESEFDAVDGVSGEEGASADDVFA